jgi:NADH dehydrogenase FAD-containing subunit
LAGLLGLLGNETLACDDLVIASPTAVWLGAACDGARRVMVSDDLGAGTCSGVFVIGDTAASARWHGGCGAQSMSRFRWALRNRLAVMLNWIWNYLSLRVTVQLITGEPR